MSFGFQLAGITVTRAYDISATAVRNYRLNVGDHIEQTDLSNPLAVIPALLREIPDIVSCGSPCQDFSMAGARKESTNASLTAAFGVIVAAVRPTWFVLENVVQAESSEAWSLTWSILKRAGYGISVSTVNAAHFGVPQRRRRMFAVGRMGERDGFLESAIADAASEFPMTLRDLFGSDVQEALYFAPRMPKKRGIWSADEPAPTIRASSARPIPTTYSPHPDDAALVQNGFVYARPLHAGRGVRSIDEPMTTITRTSWERPTKRYFDNPNPSDPVPVAQTATLTLRQISRIQGFPENWQWVASAKRDIHQMIANAVPPPVAKTIAEVILARHNGETTPVAEHSFVRWLSRQGKTPTAARNIKSLVNRGRRILGGRTFSSISSELAELEKTLIFCEMRSSIKSNMRQALRLYGEHLDSKKVRTKRRDYT